MEQSDAEIFLSTPSARRATVDLPNKEPRWMISIHALRKEGDQRHYNDNTGLRNFYPRPPRGGRRAVICAGQVPPAISIHVLREEGDRAGVGQVAMESQFLSTSSARRATVPQPAEMRGLKQFLSTSSARRATPRSIMRLQVRYNFYPRPPRGGRRRLCGHRDGGAGFLSTSSARRATQRYGDRILWQYISIHVLREEGDTENSAHANQYG